MAERSPDFEIQDIQELKVESENQNTKKSIMLQVKLMFGLSSINY